MKKETNLSGKKILVTGGSGFIGSHLCRRLLSMKSEVVGVSRKNQQGNDNCSYWYKADLKNIQEVKKLLKTTKPDIIFHLASHVVGARDLERVMPTFQDILASTVNILIEATHIGCEKIILIGSLEEPENLDNFILPSSPYAAAKYAASAYGRMFHALYNTPVSIARLFMVYGPGQQDLSKFIPYVTLSLLKKNLPRLTSGKRMVDWIYVGDVVDGLVKMIQAQNIEGKTIDIGSGELESIQNVAVKLSKLIAPTVEINFSGLPDRPLEQVRAANISDTLEKIGWVPKVPLTKGLLRTVDWYKSVDFSE